MVGFDETTAARLERPVWPSVLLLHPDETSRTAWRLQLAEFPCSEAASWAEAQKLLADRQPHVLVCPWPWARDQLPEVVHDVDIRILYVGTTLPDEVVEDAAAGHRVGFAKNDAPLPTRVLDLTWPLRAAGRQVYEGLTARLLALPEPVHVLDLSLGGFAFVLPKGLSPERFLPGAQLGSVTLERQGQQCIECAAAEVRDLGATNDGYRVGCSFLPQPSLLRGEDLDGATARQGELLHVAALLRNALRGSGVSLSSPRLRRPWVARAGEVDLERGVLSLRAGTHFAPYDVVHVNLEVSGVSYSFAAPVLAVTPSLELKLPTQLEARNRRYVERCSVTRAVPSRIRHAFAVAPVPCDLLDLSTAGCSFTLPEPVPIGALLQIEVDTGGQPTQCQGVVRTLSAEENGRIRMGAAFQDTDEASRLRLARLVVAQKFPRLLDGGHANPEELMALFERAGLMKPEHLAMIAPDLPKVRQTFASLSKVSGTMFNSWIVPHEGRVGGHVSMFQAYRSTWFVQQLAVEAGLHQAAYELNMGAAELFSQLPDIEYFKIAFFADNKWPARVFGRFARRINDWKTSLLRALVPATLFVDQPLEGPAGNEFEVHLATSTDLLEVERYFVQSRPELLLKADDLTYSTLTLEAMDARYARHGLYRRRKLLMAVHRGSLSAFAVVEQASPGLNLLEHFNSVRVHFLRPLEASLRQQARAALLKGAQELFAREGRRFARLWLRSSEAEEYQALGLVPGRRVVEWTCHRSRFRSYTEHLDRLFSAFLKHRRRRPSPGPSERALASGASNAPKADLSQA